MGTPSVIGIRKECGRYVTITCNYDGYLSYMGKLLLENYNEDKVQVILELGNASSLGQYIENCPKTFAEDINGNNSSMPFYENDYSVFYVRDRKEDLEDNKAYVCDSKMSLKREFKYINNFYILEDNKWYHSYDCEDFVQLTEDYIKGIDLD